MFDKNERFVYFCFSLSKSRLNTLKTVCGNKFEMNEFSQKSIVDRKEKENAKERTCIDKYDSNPQDVLNPLLNQLSCLLNKTKIHLFTLCQRYFRWFKNENYNQIYLGIQSDGVLSTSHAANNFIGTGLFMLVNRSNRVGFSANTFDIFN